MTKIKICGLKREEDIELINDVRPDYCGFIIDFPKSPRSISLKRVRELTAALDREHVKAVGVFVDSPPELAAELLLDGTIDLVQLHGAEDEAYIEVLRSLIREPRERERSGDGRIIRAFTIRSRDDIDTALKSSADYILLDQGKGSGRTFDWSVIPDGMEGLTDRQWFLAGGLSEDNISEAIDRFHPFAVDLSSSVETDGFKDPSKVRRITELVRTRQML